MERTVRRGTCPHQEAAIQRAVASYGRVAERDETRNCEKERLNHLALVQIAHGAEHQADASMRVSGNGGAHRRAFRQKCKRCASQVRCPGNMRTCAFISAQGSRRFDCSYPTVSYRLDYPVPDICLLALDEPHA